MAPKFEHIALGDRIVVDVTPARRTATGLIIPESAKADGQRGIVLAHGAGGRNNAGALIAMDAQIRPGVTLLFGRYAGTEFELDGLKIKIIREEDVLLVLTPKAANKVAA